MKTAVIYARYSSENQTEQSIEGQPQPNNTNFLIRGFVLFFTSEYFDITINR